ncbi:MAG: flavodoxin [Eubacteriales bacterium]|nr:flavodoxin [Eubacteriales bacterium]
MKKRLIAYFSRPDENYFKGEMKFVEEGNTKIAAKKLQEITKADLLEIKMETPYSKNYKECVEQAKADLEAGARPKLVDLPENLDDYTIVYLGFPNYCGTLPMPVLSFLESFDFTGKKIRPFCTHEGSGLGRSEGDILMACPTAVLDMGCAVLGHEVNDCEDFLEMWVRSFYGGQL